MTANMQIVLPSLTGRNVEPRAGRDFPKLCCAVVMLAVMTTGNDAHAADDANPESSIPPRPIKIAKVAANADHLKRFYALEGNVPPPFFDAAESIRCRQVQPKICRDLARTEIQLTSMRFMVPEVPGLQAKSLTFRRNTVIANYTFR